MQEQCRHMEACEDRYERLLRCEPDQIGSKISHNAAPNVGVEIKLVGEEGRWPKRVAERFLHGFGRSSDTGMRAAYPALSIITPHDAAGSCREF